MKTQKPRLVYRNGLWLCVRDHTLPGVNFHPELAYWDWAAINVSNPFFEGFSRFWAGFDRWLDTLARIGRGARS